MLEREPGRFIGKTLEIPTFLSTTICENMVGDVTYDRSLERYELVIRTPKGTPAGFLPESQQLGFTKHGGEKEVSSYRWDDITDKKNYYAQSGRTEVYRRKRFEV